MSPETGVPVHEFVFDDEKGELLKPNILISEACDRVEAIIGNRQITLERAPEEEFRPDQSPGMIRYATLVGPTGGRVELQVHVDSKLNESGVKERSHAISLPEAVETAIDLAGELKEGEVARTDGHDEFSVSFPDKQSRDGFKDVAFREHYDPEGKLGGSWSDNCSRVVKDNTGKVISEEHNRFIYNFQLPYPDSALGKNLQAIVSKLDKSAGK